MYEYLKEKYRISDAELRAINLHREWRGVPPATADDFKGPITRVEAGGSIFSWPELKDPGHRARSPRDEKSDEPEGE